MQTTPDTARTGLVYVADDPITGEPIYWAGRGRKADHASTHSRDLMRFIGYAEAELDHLLKHGDSKLGRFVDAAHAKEVARRLNRMRNVIFNACKARGAQLRAEGTQAIDGGACVHSCQEVEAA